MVASGVANLFSAQQWAKDPLGNLLKSSADIATGVTIVLGSIAGLAIAIVVILTALTILTFGALGPVAAAVIPFCLSVAGTVGPWAITAAEIALVLQGLVLIKNLIDAATASTAEQLQTKSDEMTQDATTAGQMAMQIGMHELMGGGEEGGVPGAGEELPPVEAGETPAAASAAAETPAAAPAGETPAAAPAAAETPAAAPAAETPAAPPAGETPAPETPAAAAGTESPAAQEGATPAESLPEEAKTSDGKPVAGEATSPDGEAKVKAPETGECEICQSPCEKTRTKYADALENPDLEAKLQEAENISDPKARAEAIAELVPELEATQSAAGVLNEFAEAQGLASPAELQGEALEQHGVSETPTPGGKPQPEHFEVGNFGHTYAEELIPENQMPRGLDPEVTVKLPGGEVRLDRVDWNEGKIYEIKPNTPENIAAGQQQAALYEHYMNQEYPLGEGRSWQSQVVTYDYPTAKKILLGK
jgi:hypothetical protein